MGGEDDHPEAESIYLFATLVTHPFLRPLELFIVPVAVSFGPATGMKTDERRRPPGRLSERADHCHAARDERHDHLSKIRGRAAS